MKRIRLTIAYDGTAYVGWQIQKNGIAVEQVINEHLSKLLKENITIIGASRTDSGVHARGNVAVFDTETRIPSEKISYALNQSLPADIRIVRSEEVEADFHPRHTDCVKTYQYTILNARYYLPTVRLYAGYVYYPLDIEKMKEAAKYLTGTHDFEAFSSAGGQQKTTVRTIYSLEVTSQWLEPDDFDEATEPKIKTDKFNFDKDKTETAKTKADKAKQEAEIIEKQADTETPEQKFLLEGKKNNGTMSYRPKIVKITVTGDGFLYNMVRIIAGTLEKVGMGIYPPEYVKEILESRDRRLSAPKAAACGLTLMKINYFDATHK